MTAWRYYLQQLQTLLRSKKNLAVILLVLGASVWATVSYLPAHAPVERYSARDTRLTLAKNRSFMAKYDPDRINFTTLQMAAANLPQFITHEHKQLRAAQAGDWDTVATQLAAELQLTDTLIFEQGQPWLSYPLSYYNDPSVISDTHGKNLDAHYWNNEAQTRLRAAVRSAVPVTRAVVNQDTVVQRLQRLLVAGGATAFFLLAGCLASDLIVGDRKHRSVLRNLPLTYRWRVDLKALAVLSVTLATAAVSVALIAGVTLVHGEFGGLRLPVAVYTKYVFHTITMGRFLGEAAGLSLLVGWLVIRLSLLLQLWTRNEYVSLVGTSFLTLAEPLYFIHGLVLAAPATLYLLPSYFNVGKLLSGVQNFRYDTVQMTFGLGVGLLLAAIAVAELLLAATLRVAKLDF